MHIAIIGGTYNPIHYGHLRAAEEVREGMGLDKVVFMPAFIPPHKHEDMPPASARLEMVKAAIMDNPAFDASDIEIRRKGVSYTVDTVRELRKDRGIKVSLIIGNDSFNEIASWHEFERLIELSSFIVVPRPGYPVKKPGEALPVELARKFWYDSATESFLNSHGNSITYVQTTLIDISSSDIRRRVASGSSVRYLLPDQVIEYITKNRLYR